MRAFDEASGKTQGYPEYSPYNPECILYRDSVRILKALNQKAFGMSMPCGSCDSGLGQQESKRSAPLL